MNKKTLFVIGGIAAVVLLCVCVTVAGISLYVVGKNTAEIVPTLQAAATEIPQVVDPAVFATPTRAPLVDPVQPAEPSGDGLYEASLVANRFLLELSDNNYADAISYTDSALRNEPNTAEQLRVLVEDQGLDPSIWEWTDSQEDGQVVHLDGVVNFEDDRRGVVNMEVTFEEGEWRVNYLNLETSGESVDPGPYSTWTEARTAEEVAFAKGAADVFLIDWQEGDFDGTWLMTSQAMKDSMENDQQKLQDFLTGLQITPSDWTWNDDYQIIELDGETYPVIEINGTVDYEEGSSGPTKIQLQWEDGYWSVRFIDVKAN